jgi:hypothetical protein
MSDKIEITQDNYEQILELAKSSNSRTDLLKKLGWGKNGVQLKKLDQVLNNNNFDYKNFPNVNPRKIGIVIEEYTKDTLTKYVAQCHSYAGVLRLFDKSKSGGSIKILQRYIRDYGLDTSHFNLNDKYVNPAYFNKKSNEEIFIKDSPVDTQLVKNRILKYSLIEYKCHGKGCTITGDWLGNQITLQLEHKNGNNRDHRLENLEFLCPNCHSVTLTWGARNIKNRKIKVKNEIFIRKLQLDKENLLDNILPQCNSSKEVFEKYKLIVQGRSYEGLDVILRENSSHVNVIEFNKRKEVKVVSYPPIDELLEMVKTKGFSQIGRNLGCSDNAIRAHLRKQKIDVKSLK